MKKKVLFLADMAIIILSLVILFAVIQGCMCHSGDQLNERLNIKSFKNCPEDVKGYLLKDSPFLFKNTESVIDCWDIVEYQRVVNKFMDDIIEYLKDKEQNEKVEIVETTLESLQSYIRKVDLSIEDSKTHFEATVKTERFFSLKINPILNMAPRKGSDYILRNLQHDLMDAFSFEESIRMFRDKVITRTFFETFQDHLFDVKKQLQNGSLLTLDTKDQNVKKENHENHSNSNFKKGNHENHSKLIRKASLCWILIVVSTLWYSLF